MLEWMRAREAQSPTQRDETIEIGCPPRFRSQSKKTFSPWPMQKIKQIILFFLSLQVWISKESKIWIQNYSYSRKYQNNFKFYFYQKHELLLVWRTGNWYSQDRRQKIEMTHSSIYDVNNGFFSWKSWVVYT